MVGTLAAALGAVVVTAEETPELALGIVFVFEWAVEVGVGFVVVGVVVGVVAVVAETVIVVAVAAAPEVPKSVRAVMAAIAPLPCS